MKRPFKVIVSISLSFFKILMILVRVDWSKCQKFWAEEEETRKQRRIVLDALMYTYKHKYLPVILMTISTWTEETYCINLYHFPCLRQFKVCHFQGMSSIHKHIHNFAFFLKTTNISYPQKFRGKMRLKLRWKKNTKQSKKRQTHIKTKHCR